MDGCGRAAIGRDNLGDVILNYMVTVYPVFELSIMSPLFRFSLDFRPSPGGSATARRNDTPVEGENSGPTNGLRTRLSLCGVPYRAPHAFRRGGHVEVTDLPRGASESTRAFITAGATTSSL